MSSATSLKEELFNLKTRLETIEGQLTAQSKEIETREGKWANIEPNLTYIYNTQGERVKLNIGGEIFSTSVNTLLTIRDSFLARLVESNKIDIKEEIFIDRSPKFFPFILDYYRFKKIDFKKLTKADCQHLLIEAEYYFIDDIRSELEERLADPKFVKLETNANYIYKDVVAGTNKLEDLSDPDQNTGVCVASPGKIVVELNKEWEFNALEIGGFKGDNKIWYPDNGSGAKIFVSKDKNKWTEVGKIPSGFGNKVKNVKLKTEVSAKFVKFESNSYLGIGFLKLIKTNIFAPEI